MLHFYCDPIQDINTIRAGKRGRDGFLTDKIQVKIFITLTKLLIF